MRRRDVDLGIAALCVGGGQGAAMFARTLVDGVVDAVTGSATPSTAVNGVNDLVYRCGDKKWIQ